MKHLFAVFATICLFCSRAMAELVNTMAQFDMETRLFTLKAENWTKGRFIFWNGESEWSDPKISALVKEPFNYGFSGSARENNLILEGSAKLSAANFEDWRIWVEPYAEVYIGLSIKLFITFTREAFVTTLGVGRQEEPQTSYENSSYNFAADASLGKYSFVFRDAP